MDKPLSPAVQAVLDAVREICPAPADEIAAAALRAAADQVVPEEKSCEGGFSDSLEHQCRASERRLARAEFLAIADELRGQ